MGAISGPSSLLPDENEVGLDLDVVGDFEDEDLRDLHVVIRELRRELRLDPKVFGGEVEALLRFHLLGRELDVSDEGIGHGLVRLARTVKVPRTLAGVSLPGCSGPATSTFLISKTA